MHSNSDQAATAKCPFHRVVSGTNEEMPANAHCGVSARAAAFDVFEGAYQVDPAEALNWARAEEPVFFSPKLGYWIVTRYDQVKAVFRDTSTFSPSIALEKVTPNSPEADAVLARYGYAMGRTLVNEDEPAHMERRRALMKSFLPEDLAHHEPLVRRLVRDYVDSFVDRGEVDLIDEMLWEIPLTVALHFLGVPEEDMDTLRHYSIAHTVNTWGKPSVEEQVAVAEAVGKFWQFAGDVLQKMRAEPSGDGWMQYGIRRQAELPGVVTDSYLHSMMMAGIVAAHETTAHASANAIHLLLQNRDAWDEICANPDLIPNAVEECLRLSGSIVAWRRIVTVDTQMGDVKLPKGSRLLIVMASANQDERHFENAQILDIRRDNTVDHLTFGYGSHQCMGKNLARMEMRIFLEELSRRLPHMELVPDQTLTYLPNTSLRGPNHLRVRWDPNLNPERGQPDILRQRTSFDIGAPSKNAVSRAMLVTETERETDGVVILKLEDPQGRDLPRWTPGAHIEVLVGDYSRKYSLCGNASDPCRWQIGVLKEDNGRGGSAYIHERLATGTLIRIRGPNNNFRLDESADRFLLIAGGIGITPILAMADRLKELGKDYAVHYAGRSQASMAFVARLRRDHGDRLRLYVRAEEQRMDLEAIIAKNPINAEIYACGPARLLYRLEALTLEHSDRLHVEHFMSAGSQLDPEKEAAFEVELKDTHTTIRVEAHQTLLHALRAAGIDVPSDCEEGLCGSCEVGVFAGKVDHRDRVLSASERASARRMMTCCSRSGGGKLVLVL